MCIARMYSFDLFYWQSSVVTPSQWLRDSLENVCIVCKVNQRWLLTIKPPRELHKGV